MSIIDIEALLAKVDTPPDSAGDTLAMSAILARSGPKPSHPSQPSRGRDSVSTQNLAALANLATIQPEMGAVAAAAHRLLPVLADREGWSPSDISDGHEAIQRNPQGALELFHAMLERLQDIDDRVPCTACLNFAHGKCRQHQRAGLTSSVVGRDLATIRQHCPAFVGCPTFDGNYQEANLD